VRVTFTDASDAVGDDIDDGGVCVSCVNTSTMHASGVPQRLLAARFIDCALRADCKCIANTNTSTLSSITEACNARTAPDPPRPATVNVTQLLTANDCTA